MIMLPLPWEIVGPVDAGCVASVTELRLRRWRDVPRLTADALRLRKHLKRHEGAVALGLAAAPHRRTFWTLSLWRDDAALTGYRSEGTHAEVMRTYRGKLESSRSCRWTTGEQGLPKWRDAVRRLHEASPSPG
jgi:hypothetical protein